jgi:hypothetical protein
VRSEYEIGDLVRLLKGGRISLCKGIDDGSIGIVTTIHCPVTIEVVWCDTQETSRMHVDYVERVKCK